MPNNLESRLLKEWKDALQDPTMKPFVKCLYQLFNNYENIHDIDDLEEHQFVDAIHPIYVSNGGAFHY
ncbi:hypothetical protein DFQ30_010053 [Apophysomyces sp. BC1015]|nr:hypothetical protein DFQ30_010053 [Apophysomyces sp. BC1015]